MSVGSPGFNGNRLREAREARGFTGVALTEILGVSRGLISQYEKGDASPSPDKLYLIAAALNVPVDFFLLPDRQYNVEQVFYRSLASATKAGREKAKARLYWFADLIYYLAEFVTFPDVDIPDLAPPKRMDFLTRISASEIEHAAENTRHAWQLGDGPISNVAWLLENKGMIGTRGVLETETIDSFSAWPGGRPCVVLGADKDSASRSRFDAAHELGHAVLHRDVPRSQFTDGQKHPIIEWEANRFASAFLLPASSFPMDLPAPTLQAMQNAKPRWVVSIGAMVYRLGELEAIPEDEIRRMWLARSRRGWQRLEPLDDTIPVEQPRALNNALCLVVDQGVKSKEQILRELARKAEDIESLAGLPTGYFGDQPSPIRLRDRVAPVATRNGGERAEIVRLRSN